MQISLADYVKRLKEASEILDALDEAEAYFQGILG